MNPGRFASMSTTPDVNGPMALARHADLDVVIPAVKAPGFGGLEMVAVMAFIRPLVTG